MQTDHVDWGFRFSTIYGENYRYTTSYGLASYQLLKRNDVNGYDFPMVYGEIYIPQVAQGLVNGNPTRDVAPNKNHTFLAASDVIAHF